MIKESLFRNKLLNDYAHEMDATDGSINEQLNVNGDSDVEATYDS